MDVSAFLDEPTLTLADHSIRLIPFEKDCLCIACGSQVGYFFLLASNITHIKYIPPKDDGKNLSATATATTTKNDQDFGTFYIHYIHGDKTHLDGVTSHDQLICTPHNADDREDLLRVVKLVMLSKMGVCIKDFISAPYENDDDVDEDAGSTSQLTDTPQEMQPNMALLIQRLGAACSAATALCTMPIQDTPAVEEEQVVAYLLDEWFDTYGRRQIEESCSNAKVECDHPQTATIHRMTGGKLYFTTNEKKQAFFTTLGTVLSILEEKNLLCNLNANRCDLVEHCPMDVTQPRHVVIDVDLYHPLPAFAQTSQRHWTIEHVEALLAAIAAYLHVANGSRDVANGSRALLLHRAQPYLMEHAGKLPYSQEKRPPTLLGRDGFHIVLPDIYLAQQEQLILREALIRRPPMLRGDASTADAWFTLRPFLWNGVKDSDLDLWNRTLDFLSAAETPHVLLPGCVMQRRKNRLLEPYTCTAMWRYDAAECKFVKEPTVPSIAEVLQLCSFNINTQL